jgi:hypothetical protein
VVAIVANIIPPKARDTEDRDGIHGIIGETIYGLKMGPSSLDPKI